MASPTLSRAISTYNPQGKLVISIIHTSHSAVKPSCAGLVVVASYASAKQIYWLASQPAPDTPDVILLQEAILTNC